jgi:hypothetical protein
LITTALVTQKAKYQVHKEKVTHKGRNTQGHFRKFNVLFIFSPRDGVVQRQVRRAGNQKASNAKEDEIMVAFLGQSVYGRRHKQEGQNEPILQVKEKIEEKEGIPTSQQYLVFAGLLLDATPDGQKTLHDYSIKAGSVLKLEKMKVYVRTASGKFTLSNLEPTHTIQQIKEMIEGKQKIASKDQRLLFGDAELDDNGKSLADCKIQHKLTLNLEKVEEDVSEYDVSLGDWQSSFGYQQPNSPVKKVGKRKKKKAGALY